MASLNRVTLIGNLGRGPEIHATAIGGRIATFPIATTETWRDKQTGERQSRTEWHRVVIFNEGLISLAEKYLHKGSRVFLQGQLQTRKWTDANGEERYVTEITLSRFRGEVVLLGPASINRASAEPAAYQPAA